MITQTQYVKHSGLSKGQVSKLVARGMPLGSLDEADRWRGMTAKRTVVVRDRPVTGDEIQSGIDASTDRQQGDSEQGGLVSGANSPAGAYERQRQIERAAYALAVRALKAGQPDAGRLVQIHASAVRNLAAARAEVLTVAEREARLLSADWVRRVMVEHDGAVVALLKAMPKQLAGRIAPHDPEHAERELETWVQDVCLKTLHQTNPWK